MISIDLLEALHSHDLYKAALSGLSDDQKALVSAAAEGLLVELARVLEAAASAPEVVSPTEQDGDR